MNKDIEHSHHEFLNSTKHQIEMGLKILNLLFLSNAGAIVAFLGFLSHKANENSLSSFWFYGALSFIIGLVLILGSFAYAYFQQMALTQKYRSEYNFYKESENYNNLLNNYNNMKADPTASNDFLTEQLSFLTQLHSSLQTRYQRISIPFSDKRLAYSIILGFLSFIAFLLGTILILWGFR